MPLLRRALRARGVRRQAGLIRRFLWLLLALPLAYLAAGTAGGLIRTGAAPGPDAGIDVLLLRSPIHTDLVLPVTPEVAGEFAFLAEAGLPVAEAAWLVVGWGGRAFYIQTATWSDLRLDTTWASVTGDDAVMHVELGGAGWDTSALDRVALTPAQFSRLLDGIRASFAEAAPLDVPGYSDFDRFYPATGRFQIWRTCNVWVGDMLRQAGARVGVWTPFNWTLP